MNFNISKSLGVAATIGIIGCFSPLHGAHAAGAMTQSTRIQAKDINAIKKLINGDVNINPIEKGQTLNATINMILNTNINSNKTIPHKDKINNKNNDKGATKHMAKNTESIKGVKDKDKQDKHPIVVKDNNKENKSKAVGEKNSTDRAKKANKKSQGKKPAPHKGNVKHTTTSYSTVKNTQKNKIFTKKSTIVYSTSIPNTPIFHCEVSSGDNNLKPWLRLVRSRIMAQFKVTDIGGYRAGDPQDHGQGLALDVMVPQSSKLGDDIANWAIKNSDALKIKYVIWKQHIWLPNDPTVWRGMEDRGSITQNHYDHVHLSFYNEMGTCPNN